MSKEITFNCGNFEFCDFRCCYWNYEKDTGGTGNLLIVKVWIKKFE